MRPISGLVALSLAGALAVALPAAAVVPGEPVRISGDGTVKFTPGVPHHRVVSSPAGHTVVAWLESVSGENYQLMARSRTAGGAWSATQQVSDTQTGAGPQAVQAFDLAVNDDGDAVLAWRQFDTFGGEFEHMVFAATLPRGGSGWSTARIGGEQHGVSAFETPSAAVLPDGTAVVGWTGYDADGGRQAYAAEGSASGWSAPTLISDTGGIPVNCLPDAQCEHGDSRDVVLAADGAGVVRAVFLGATEVSDGAGGKQTRHWVLRTSRGPAGGWAAATPVTSVGSDYELPEAAVVAGDLAGDGFASAVVLAGTEVEDPGVRLSYDGVVRTFRREPNGYRLAALDVAGGHAAGLFAYASGGGQLRVSSLDAGDEAWGDLTDPTGGDTLSNSPMPRLGVHPDGEQTVLWIPEGQRIRITQRESGSAAWPTESLLLPASAPYQNLPLLAAADDGTGVVAYRGSLEDEDVTGILALGFSKEETDPLPPLVAMTAPEDLLLRNPTWEVAWQATNQGGGVGTVEVAESETSWDQPAATSYTSDGYAPDESSYSVIAHPANTAGTTFCYAARGEPAGAGNTGEWSAPLCTVTPVDDRTLTRVGSDWKRKTGSGRYAETYLQTGQKGAKLRLEGVHASTLALLVEKGRGHGKLKVSFDGEKLAAVSLDGKKKKRVVVPVASWDDVRVGTLVLKVVSATGRPVRVDGVHAAQPNDAAFTD